MAVLSKLERAEGFTETEQLLAHYVLDHAADVAYWNISELAEATYTSNASIIRLCRKLGLDGFREFRVELAADLEKRRLAHSNIDVDYPVDPTEPTEFMLAKMAVLTKEAVDGCYEALEPRDIEDVAAMICDASMVYLFAIGDSQISAEAFSNMLIKIGVRSAIACRHGDEVAIASSACSGDIAIFVSYRGDYLNVAEEYELPRILKERGCKCVLLSSAEKPFWVDKLISFPVREDVGTNRMATFYSQACFRYIFNCLYAAVFTHDFTENVKRATSS